MVSLEAPTAKTHTLTDPPPPPLSPPPSPPQSNFQTQPHPKQSYSVFFPTGPPPKSLS